MSPSWFVAPWLALALLGPAAAPARTSTASVDVNRATEAELLTLPGIGPARSRAIVERRARRPFRSVRELLQVPGIGPRTLERLRPHVHVGPSPDPARTGRTSAFPAGRPPAAGGARPPAGAPPARPPAAPGGRPPPPAEAGA